MFPSRMVESEYKDSILSLLFVKRIPDKGSVDGNSLIGMSTNASLDGGLDKRETLNQFMETRLAVIAKRLNRFFALR